MDFIKFNLQYDVVKLKSDLKNCQKYKWPLHFNQNDFTGHWSSIALRSISGNESDISSQANATYKDTQLLDECHYFKEIITNFQCPLESVRLLSLSPNSYIKAHKDPDAGYEDGFFRIHIPVQTNSDVVFTLNNQTLAMKEGDCWYANFNLTHFVANNGNQDRIHLVIDGIRNQWSDQLFEKHGYDLSLKSNDNLDEKTKQLVIENLKQINTPTAKKLIENLINGTI
ncbi:MAG: aspartyl/asparaginyl beta-hydroxylase domain-containing protein [Pseudarcicella sp.]|nr:aspartyl/asparaginyl beta-hydroxylase domain-containing protein [Pseudarcicella sp.]